MIGQWVLNEACRIAQAWRDEGLPALRVAVNVSAHQFLQGDIRTSVRQALMANGLPASALELEITESLLMKRETEILAILQALHDLCVSLVIDYFGTGYSSLAYLKSFPLDGLKIDRSFISDLEHNPDDLKITATIIAMAKAMGLRAVAEGVETPQQRDVLQRLHCDCYQGYLCTPPLSEAAFRDFMLTHRA